MLWLCSSQQKHTTRPRKSAYVYLNIPVDKRQLCANVRVHMWKVIMRLISGLACVCECVSGQKQQGECVKLFCVAEITPGPYQLHQGA